MTVSTSPEGRTTFVRLLEMAPTCSNVVVPVRMRA